MVWAGLDTHSSPAPAGRDLRSPSGSTRQTSSICWAVRTGVAPGRHAVRTRPYHRRVSAFLERSRVSEPEPQQAARSKGSWSLGSRGAVGNLNAGGSAAR